MRKKITLCLFLFACATLSVYAQKPAVYDQPIVSYSTAWDLFNKQKYGQALESFDNLAKAVSTPEYYRTLSQYYAAVSALELYHPDAEMRLKEFIRLNPSSPLANRASFQLGRHFFRKKRYGEVIKAMAKVPTYELTDEETDEYNFTLGYSYFVRDSLDKAKLLLADVKDGETKFAAPATYCFGHIAYMQKNYETALQHFEKLKTDEAFGQVVPYYIVQIFYLQGKYNDVISYAPSLFDSANVKRAPDIARILGESCYRTLDFKQAAQWLEYYVSKTTAQISREENYELAMSYYQTNVYNKAISFFSKTLTPEDSMAQNSWYLMADCYIKSSQKSYARNAFLSASKMNFDALIKEDALFNYAKLSYELALNPYNEAISAFQEYIAKYPKSSRLNEAYEYLLNILMSTKNYKDALATLEEMKNRNERFNAAFQHVAYYRGVELFNDGKMTEASSLFSKAMKFPYDKYVSANCKYWIAESYFNQGLYDSAATSYRAFYASPGAVSLAHYNTANYSIGYCSFKKKDYSSAGIAFRKFLKEKTNEDSKIVADANLRAGDCYYMQKDHNSAVEYYDAAIKLSSVDKDYALYQKGMALGLLGKHKDKINVLLSLVELPQRSVYDAPAKYEIGRTYQILDNSDKSVEYFQKVVDEYPQSAFVKSALLHIGQVYFNEDKHEAALKTLKELVEKYPATDDSRQALETIKNIYVDLNKAEDFFVYVKGLSFANIDVAAQDSITYQATEKQYMDGNCEASIVGFAGYIEKFPKGYFITNSNFYKAECEYNKGNLQEALVGYGFVANQPKNNFTESALVKSAQISMKLKNYSNALVHYTKLEKDADYKENILDAQIGIMRCQYGLEKWNEAVIASRNLLQTEKLSTELRAEAEMTIGNCYYKMDSLAKAIGQYQFVARTARNEASAEAKYNIAQIFYKQQLYEESEKAVFELINQVPSYDIWIARGFILLADLYEVRGNLPQAKATLNSIIDNYDGPELVQIAQEKLNKILLKEKEADQKKVIEILQPEIKLGPEDPGILNSEKSNEGGNN
ncbi:MAG: tetratricopeptide repeat protein [Bacteroidota bacterium]